MINVIFWIIVGLAALAILKAGDNMVRDHYVKPVIAAYDIKLKNANDRADDAEAANARLRPQLAQIAADAKACGDGVDILKKDAEEATKRAHDAIAAKLAAQKATQLAINALRARASGPATLGNACAQADAILSDLARDVRAALGLTSSVEMTVRRLPSSPQ